MEQFAQALPLFFEAIGINIIFFRAGIAGGIISLAFEKKPSFWQAVAFVAGAGFSANFLTPILLEYSGIKSAGGIAFLIGLFFFEVVPIFLVLFQTVAKDKSWAKLVVDFITKRIKK